MNQAVIVLRWTLLLIGGFALANTVLALFERFAPRRVVRFFMKYIGNPVFRLASGVMPGYAVVEVIGRRTGHSHRVNVGGRIIGDAFWFLARSDAQYLRNLQVNPKIRIRVHGQWHDGVAELCPDDDPRRRLWLLNPANGAFLWLVGAELSTVRVNLTH